MSSIAAGASPADDNSCKGPQKTVGNAEIQQKFDLAQNSPSRPDSDARSPQSNVTSPPSKGRDEQTSGKWKITCENAGRCRLSQSILAGADRLPILVARIYRQPSPVLVLTTPPGIYLSPGVALKIGAGKTRRYPFETCDADGCHTGLKLDAALVKDLASVMSAKVSFFDGTQKVVTAVLDLDGFRKGYEALK